MSKNRIAAALCAAVMMGTSVPAMALMPVSVCAESDAELQFGDYSYTIETASDGHQYAMLTRYNGMEEVTEVVVPAEMPVDPKKADGEKVPVESLGHNAFRGVDGDKTVVAAITKITLPAALCTIEGEPGAGPFSDCAALQDINLQETQLEFLGEYAFAGCGNLTTVQFPDTLKVINAGAFDTSGLTEITLPDSLEVIGTLAFRDTQLKTITIPENVFQIGNDAFQHCKDLEIEFKCINVEIREGEDTLFGWDEDFVGKVTCFEGSTEEKYAKNCLVNAAEVKSNPVPAPSGDVNRDGAVNIMDVIVVNKFIVGEGSLPGWKGYHANVDGNAEVSAGDSLLILKKVLEIIDEFPAAKPAKA